MSAPDTIPDTTPAALVSLISHDVIPAAAAVAVVVPHVTVPQIQSVLAEYLNLVSATSFLTPEEKTAIQKLNLPDQSEFLEKLADIINCILNDGIIYSHDIPQLVVLSSNLIHQYISTKSLANVGGVSILKFILTSLLNSNLIPIPPNQILKAQMVLDSSFTLLEIVLPSVGRGTTSCFSFLFGSQNVKGARKG